MEMTEEITEVMTTNFDLTFAPDTADVPGVIQNSLPRFLIVYISYIIIGITGVLGNGLVLIVLLNTRDMWDATNLLIANQSLIDFFGSLSVIAFKVVPVPPFETAGPVLARYLCYLWYPNFFPWSFSFTSVLNLVFISFERFYAVRYPIRYRSNFTIKPAFAASILAWIMGMGWGSFLPATSSLENGICRRHVWPRQDTAAVVSGLTFFVCYLAPLFTMISIYTYIGHVLKMGGAIKKFEDQAAGSQPAEATVPRPPPARSYRQIARRKVMTTMIIVTVTSLLCWTPSNLYFIAYASGANIDFTSFWGSSVQCILLSNNSINPFIYIFKYQKFQNGLRRLLRLGDSRSPAGEGTRDSKAESTNMA
ncbi:substance-P receptor-like [Lytechinus variegatus]|uniref:substance-P receptor-like n=1 Tax=Lytechinus variegatus TaxID=7654 RepID=UPI001BB1F334|nr:substance-P receptor-like [Lytechinus variegatus]